MIAVVLPLLAISYVAKAQPSPPPKPLPSLAPLELLEFTPIVPTPVCRQGQTDLHFRLSYVGDSDQLQTNKDRPVIVTAKAEQGVIVNDWKFSARELPASGNLVYMPRKGDNKPYFEQVKVTYFFKGLKPSELVFTLLVTPCKFKVEYKLHESWNFDSPSQGHWHAESTEEGVGQLDLIRSDDGSENATLKGQVTVEGWATEEGLTSNGLTIQTIQPGHGKGTYQVVGSLKREGAQAYLEVKLVGLLFPGTSSTVVYRGPDGTQQVCPNQHGDFWEGTSVDLEYKFIGQPIRFSLEGETKSFARPLDISSVPNLLPDQVINATEDGEITVEPDQEAPLPVS